MPTNANKRLLPTFHDNLKFCSGFWWNQPFLRNSYNEWLSRRNSLSRLTLPFMLQKQGCQMVHFQTKKIAFWVNFGGLCYGRCKFIYFVDIWSILRPLDILYGYLVYFVAIWYVFPRVGILYNEKSGNLLHTSSYAGQ
jgi:hypothetical protein